MRHSFTQVRYAIFALILSTIAVASVRADTPPALAASFVSISGEVATPRHLDVPALHKFPRRAFDAAEHGKTAHWEGVALSVLLADAGVPLGDALRGKNLALYVVVSAADGYRAVYSLAELDPAMRDSDVILADRRDGQPLDGKEGPFRIVAKDEKRPARWVRQVVAIDVLRASSP